MQNQIKSVEHTLNSIIQENDSLLNKAGGHILSSGGKRVRPYFALLSGSFGPDQSNIIKTATALEIIHMASLIHDDYIDNSDKRRGVQSVHQVYSTETAIQTGHYLLASALRLIADIEDEDYHRYFAEVILEVCYGEFDQMADRFHPIHFTQYLRRINRKTAILLEASCRLGAMSAGADEKIVFHLSKFGHFMGMSFQIIDDILDYSSTEEELGKPVGSDIRNGHWTLPLMCALQHDKDLQVLLEQLYPNQDEVYFDEIISRVQQQGIEEAKRISRLYAEKAYDHLMQLPSIEARDEMENLLRRMTMRSF